MPGSGKSFLGKKIAEKLNYVFIDLDKVIERKENAPLQQVLDKHGDKKFMELEEKTVFRLKYCPNNCIFSPGGSVIYSPKAMNFLRKKSTVIYLMLPFEAIKKRLINAETRGIVGLKEKGLKNLFYERKPFYERYAHLTLKITPDLTTKEVLIFIKSYEAHSR